MIAPTTPPSSVLDTLKHTVFRTIDLIEVAQDMVGGSTADSADVDDAMDLLDVAKRYLLEALAEHIPGVNPRGIGAPYWFHFAEAREAARTYDDGSRVVMHLNDGHTVHVRYPRLEK